MKELDWRSLVAEETLPALSVETKKVLGLFTWVRGRKLTFYSN